MADSSELKSVQAPFVSLSLRIRDLHDGVDKVHDRDFGIMVEGIQLSTIVVVGDQSSGKSSVLESLSGISLPCGQGVCTRVPLKIKLQNHPNLQKPELYLEFHGKVVPTDETHVADAINLATDEIAGKGKGISDTPLTLVVKKNGVPDLTLVDLPGITRVPVHGQPENIYEQISDIIMDYITPETSIILNVLSANVDFSTCESIRMSQKVDKTGERTLVVVTKADIAHEGLLEKVTLDDDVNISLGYVFVRNRIGDESYVEARAEEAKLLETHPLLSKIDKSIVGIPVLAQKLAESLGKKLLGSMKRCLSIPEIYMEMDDKMNERLCEQHGMLCHFINMLPAHDEVCELSNVLPENMSIYVACMRILGSVTEYVIKIANQLILKVEQVLDKSLPFPDKGERLKKNINRLKESRDTLGKILDQIALLGDGVGIAQNLVDRCETS